MANPYALFSFHDTMYLQSLKELTMHFTTLAIKTTNENPASLCALEIL